MGGPNFQTKQGKEKKLKYLDDITSEKGLFMIEFTKKEYSN